MQNLLMTIIIATIFSALVESVLPSGSIKKPALCVAALITLLMILSPFADVFIKAKENRLFTKGEVFIEKNY